MPRILFLLSLLFIGCQAKQENKDEIILEKPMQEKGKADIKGATVRKKKKPKKNTLDTKNALDIPSSTNPIDYKTKEYSTFHEEAKAFCKKKRYNKNYYFLLDYSIPSGKNRFFIYDFKKGSIIDAKLVTHGACDVFEQNNNLWDSAKFSDRPNSHCSSKGKYKIGKRDYSGWGINVKYWIKGLEDSNKSAEKRVVVLHSWGLVSDEEIYPDYSPLSWGCPAVSNNFMTKLDGMLKKSRRPVLLWIID
jgi:hypothetical protein